MTTLHIVRQSAFTSNDFAQCLQVCQNSDIIVYTDDGCYCLTHSLISQVSAQVQQKVITDHASARAINLTHALTSSKVTAITMKDLVTLTFQAERVITWQ